MTAKTVTQTELTFARHLHATAERDVAYILWQAKPHIPMATDTFIVRQGKIMKQTFVVYPAAS